MLSLLCARLLKDDRCLDPDGVDESEVALPQQLHAVLKVRQKQILGVELLAVGEEVVVLAGPVTSVCKQPNDFLGLVVPRSTAMVVLMGQHPYGTPTGQGGHPPCAVGMAAAFSH